MERMILAQSKSENLALVEAVILNRGCYLKSHVFWLLLQSLNNKQHFNCLRNSSFLI
jgi:hypothetical protein